MPELELSKTNSLDNVESPQFMAEWEGFVKALSATDTDTARSPLELLSAYQDIQLTVVTPAGYVSDDIPVIKLIAGGLPHDTEESIELIASGHAAKTGLQGTGQTYTASHQLGTQSHILIAPEHWLEVVYNGSQDASRLGEIRIFLTARSLGLSLGGAGSNSGAGSELIFSRDSALFGPRLNGTHDIGSTVLTLSATPAEMAQYFVGQHITVGLEQFRVTAVDAAGFMITIAAPGLANANVNGPVRAAVMIGDGDTLQLPAVDYKVLSVFLEFQLVNSASVQPTYTGFGWGGYATNDDGEIGAWLGYFNNFNYRWQYGQTDPTDVPFLVALLFSTNQVAFNWWLGYYPATHTLMIEPVSTATDTRIPAITRLKIIGG